LALAIWIAALLIPLTQPSAPPRAYIRTGSATELAPAIRAAPRAMVYVECPVTTQSVHGKRLFNDMVQQLARERPKAGIQFFVIGNESDEDTEAWGKAFQDARLDNFGHQGSGWLLWLEYGRLREVDSHSGQRGIKPPSANFERTLSLWH
jgi:hypothetical protein